jgi:hypothetical protein
MILISAEQAREISTKAVEDMTVLIHDLQAKLDAELEIIFDRISHAANCGFVRISIENPSLLKRITGEEVPVLKEFFERLGYSCFITGTKSMTGPYVRRIKLNWAA